MVLARLQERLVEVVSRIQTSEKGTTEGMLEELEPLLARYSKLLTVPFQIQWAANQPCSGGRPRLGLHGRSGGQRR